MPRIAYVGADQQLHVMQPDGSGQRQVTWAQVPDGLLMWGGTGGKDVRSWPCWSPDGRWLACFHAAEDEDEGIASLRRVEVDGVQEEELLRFEGQLPIYLQWDPTGKRLAVLAQDEQELVLSTCVAGAEVKPRIIEQGAPLFFSWSPTGERILLHVGHGSSGRGTLVARDPDGRAEDELLPDSAGAFCTPFYMGGRAIYAAGEGRGSVVLAVDEQGKRQRILEEAQEGLVAMVPSPSGVALAVATAKDGDTTAYQGVWLVSVDGQQRRKLVEDACMAFFFAPSGDRLLYVTWDGDTRTATWWQQDLEGGAPQKLADFFPSRDQLFFLHFFEQFTSSHSPISPDGRWLVYASHHRAKGGLEPHPQLHVLDLSDPTAEPQRVADGGFAVFSPC